jgi:triacylglycerol lipase
MNSYKRLDLALRCAILSEIVYEDFSSDHFGQKVRDTGALIWSCHSKENSEGALFDMGLGNIFIAFRGTEADSISDWLTDLLIVPVEFREYGQVHMGFFNALNHIRVDMIADLVKLMKNYKEIDIIPRIFVTGHSLGAAMATLFCLDLLDIGIKVARLFTFGSPRVGDEYFCESFEESIKHDRFVNNNDVVVHVPPESGTSIDYTHCGTLHYFGEKGGMVIGPSWFSQVVESIKGIVADIGELGLDGFKDHSLACYIDALKGLKDNDTK